MDEQQLAEIETRWEPLYSVDKVDRLFWFDTYAHEDVSALIAEVRRLKALVEDTA